MRERHDQNGNLIGYHNMIFDDIPDNYKIVTIMETKKVKDLSYLTGIKYLRDIRASEEFSDNYFYSKEVLSHLAIDYLYSALLLQHNIISSRSTCSVSSYLIPCAFLCVYGKSLVPC